ncbi:immunity protein 7 of polymorphic toxin system [Chryseobacterium sp. 52]|uniref:Imm7 family immunity protein n=1 Tax=Chryseobacterium sp. 52 TaxID=2035213 RepID=UPI000C187850|nr:Imm7 family immunity protein [Chryseobacterium sp. 52]PIF45763.1 immunity protein 7 of polymorphic toxin system [Chryseobacterium sp. 52]
MFDYKGWIALSYDSYEEDFVKLKVQISILNERIAKFNSEAQFAKIVNCNENYTLSLIGTLNHENGLIQELKDLLNFIGKILPATYGVIYYRDQDGLDYNSYVVLRLAKSKVEKQTDHILSPCVPIIED